MLAFYVAYLSIYIFRVEYPALLIDLKHTIFAESRYSRVIGSKSTPQTYFFQIG